MTKEEIIRMAIEAGALLNDGTSAPPYYALYPSELERFAALVAAAKQEQIIKRIEAEAAGAGVDPFCCVPLCNELIAAIRALD